MQQNQNKLATISEEKRRCGFCRKGEAKQGEPIYECTYKNGAFSCDSYGCGKHCRGFDNETRICRNCTKFPIFQPFKNPLSMLYLNFDGEVSMSITNDQISTNSFNSFYLVCRQYDTSKDLTNIIMVYIAKIEYINKVNYHLKTTRKLRQKFIKYLTHQDKYENEPKVLKKAIIHLAEQEEQIRSMLVGKLDAKTICYNNCIFELFSASYTTNEYTLLGYD